MASINIGDNASQVVKYWSQRATTQLREKLLLGSIVNKDHASEIVKGGDLVKIYSVNAPTATTNTLGVANSNVFAGSALSTTSVDLQINKVATAAYEFSSENEMFSLLNSANPEVMQSLVFAVEKAINTSLYACIVPSVAAPDHTINLITNMDNGQLLSTRLLAATAKWDTIKPWYGLLDPSYMNDILSVTQQVSSDFVPDSPSVTGVIKAQRFGFNLIEDNSLSVDTAYFLHPDAVNFAMATQMEVKFSDLHPTGKHGIMMSVSQYWGCALGIAGATKCIKITAA